MAKYSEGFKLSIVHSLRIRGTRLLLISIAFLLLPFAGCKAYSAAAENAATGSASAAEPSVSSMAAPSADKPSLRQFLHDTPGTYGWQTAAESITLDFFEDGRLAIQGSDGEATMWEGRWELHGDKLTMKREDLGKTLTVTAKRHGKKLILGDKTYTRYKP